MTPEERTGLQVQIENALLRIAVGGCTCETKTPDVQFHKERCHYRVACEVMPLVGRLKAEADTNAVRTGWDPAVGFVLEAANEGELAAYEHGACGMMAALAEVLDGKDDGAGIANDPWETLRRRVLALMAGAPPQGWKLAPLEATDAMVDAAEKNATRVAVDAHKRGSDDTEPGFRSTYRTMLEAAPGREAEPLQVVVRTGRVWIERGVQSFMLDYDNPEEPEAVEWMAQRVREVLGVTERAKNGT